MEKQATIKTYVLHHSAIVKNSTVPLLSFKNDKKEVQN